MADAEAYRLRYEQWVNLYAPELYRYAYRLVSHRQVAEDLIQETFIEAWKSIKKQPDVRQARAWLFQILRHRYWHYVRDGKAERDLSALPEKIEQMVAAAERSPLERLANKDELQRALQALSPIIRETFLMVFMEGRTCRETSENLKIPLGTVLSRLDQARRTLRAALEISRPASIGTKGNLERDIPPPRPAAAEGGETR